MISAPRNSGVEIIRVLEFRRAAQERIVQDKKASADPNCQHDV